MFESVEDGRQLKSHPISSPCEPSGSGELKRFQSQSNRKASGGEIKLELL